MQNIKDLAASSAKTWGEIAQVIDNNFKGTTDAQKNDLNYVRALDASGNPILISKKDLASVVGGLLDYAVSKTIKDCSLDDIDKAGFYAMDNSVTDIPDLASAGNPNATHWSLLVTKPYDGASVIQVIFTGPDDVYFKRYRYYGEGSVWSLWRKITPVIE